MTDNLNLKVIERKAVRGNPTLYFYTGRKYLGCLFFEDQNSADEFRLTLEAGGDFEYKKEVSLNPGMAAS